MSERPVYVYGFVVPRLEDESVGFDTSDLRGLDHEPIELIEVGGVAAAVSAAPVGRIRAQRRHLAAHQRVVAALAERTTTLPAAFGLISSENEVRDLLEHHGERVTAQAHRVHGCVEMTVKVRWADERGFERLVELDPELRAMRDEMIAAGEGAPHELKVAIGRRVEHLLGSLRAEHGSALASATAEACRELIEEDPGTEHELARATYLVPRYGIEAFESAVESLANHLDDDFAIDITGPLAPHHFVDVSIDAVQPSRAAA